MKIELESIVDREDGGADLVFDLDDEGKERLLSEGITYLTLKALSGMDDDELFYVFLGEEEEDESDQ